MTKSILRILFSKVGGFLIFLILLLFANFLVRYIPGDMYSSMVLFLDDNLALFFILMLVGIVNDVLWAFDFPLNLPAPAASAFFSYYIVMFLLRFFIFIRGYIHFEFAFPFSLLYIVPLIVLLCGYVLVFFRAAKGKEKEEQSEEQKEGEKEKAAKTFRIKTVKKEINKVKNETVKWRDVGSEFKLALYNFGKTINKLFE